MKTFFLILLLIAGFSVQAQPGKKKSPVAKDTTLTAPHAFIQIPITLLDPEEQKLSDLERAAGVIEMRKRDLIESAAIHCKDFDLKSHVIERWEHKPDGTLVIYVSKKEP